MRAGVVGLLLAAVVALAPPPASAQNRSPCAPGQPPGRPPGEPPASGRPPGRPPAYPPGECQLRISQSVAAQGETFRVAGSGFQPGCPVDIRLRPDGSVLDTIIADAEGAVSGVVQVPIDATPGAATVEAVAAPQCPDRVLSAAFEVTAAGGGTAAAPAASRGGGRSQAAGSGSGLAATGEAIGLTAAAGAALVAIGSIAVAFARRRRTLPVESV